MHFLCRVEMDATNKQLQKKDPNGNDTTIRISQVIDNLSKLILAWGPNKELLGNYDRV